MCFVAPAHPGLDGVGGVVVVQHATHAHPSKPVVLYRHNNILTVFVLVVCRLLADRMLRSTPCKVRGDVTLPGCMVRMPSISWHRYVGCPAHCVIRTWLRCFFDHCSALRHPPPPQRHTQTPAPVPCYAEPLPRSARRGLVNSESKLGTAAAAET